ncbi:hypothetical protein H2199_006154 [Coniosporium tulheliwenetii]|uniref:Uncharacterized protein n=1 Tax=Coniosporium tulheliwenetii TaxID=3383036 RepID=A0ACC2YXM0_9PEZI|nr:hypothetical protein H2199_006154 [Cladosporium sp. JES 115]
MSTLEGFATLCDECRGIFEGLWLPKEWKRPTNEELIGGNNEESVLVPADGSPWRSQLPLPGDYSGISPGPYPYQHNWVKVLGVNSVTASGKPIFSYTSPIHHNIRSLEECAGSKCHICTMLWDRLPGGSGIVKRAQSPKHVENWPEDPEEALRRIQGVVVIRPAGEAGHLYLEVMYFIDGLVRPGGPLFSVTLDLYATDVLAESLPELDESGGVAPVDAFEHLDHWLEDCTANHVRCKERISRMQGEMAERTLPTRLLEVEMTEEEPRVFLRETKDLPSDTRYMTLSHCWGGALKLRLLKELYQQFTEAIPFSRLPQTFQDAIDFTGALGVNYIWIDALCIIQDSTEDWLHEALLMASVYSYSWLNLAATSSSSGDGGFRLGESQFLAEPCIVDASWEGLTPDNYRAWVFQERMLAPRTIHFAYDQLWWECAQTRGSQCFPHGVPTAGLRIGDPDVINPVTKLLELDKDNLTASTNHWLEIVGHYTKTRLTFGSDKLVALAGVAHAIHNYLSLPENSYLAGHWRIDLELSLLWHVAHIRLAKRPVSYRAPSWSWASVDSEVYFEDYPPRDTMREHLVAKVLEAETTPVSSVFGPVTAGFLVLRAPLRRITFASPGLDPESEVPCFEKLGIGSTVLEGAGFWEYMDDISLYEQWPVEGKAVFFALITTPRPYGTKVSAMGLVLEATGAARGEYRRIGSLTVSHESAVEMLDEALRESALTEEEYLCNDQMGRYTSKIV